MKRFVYLFTFRSAIRSVRQYSSMSTSYKLVFGKYGDPCEVVEKVADDSLDVKLKENDVRVKFLASPINPSDINTIQGVYAVKPPLPAVGGNEGVAKVVEIGSKVTKLKVDDLIFPSLPGFGTWRQHAISNENDFIPLKSGLDILAAAQITVNPCTAYRMLKDFVSLKEGDTIIQNGANSAVGVNVIQMAKDFKLKTVNVVRNRPNIEQLKTELTEIGADYVVTEEELRTDKMKQIWSTIRRPVLAFNCVGGKNATDCIRQLDRKGVMVTYGGMSKQPLTIPTGSLIFHDQRFVGYWMTRWVKENANSPERKEMLDYICSSLIEGRLKGPKAIPVKFDDYKDAIKKALQDYSDGKIILTMQ